MKLHIQNLGPIKAATIDLSKRFYTFVGYNNSGKTYLANLLWCVFDIGHIQGMDFLEIFTEFLLSSQKELKNGKLIITPKDIENILLEYTDYLKNNVLARILNINSQSPIIKNLRLEFVERNTYTPNIENIENIIKPIVKFLNHPNTNIKVELVKDNIVFSNIPFDVDIYLHNTINNTTYDKPLSRTLVPISLISSIIEDLQIVPLSHFNTQFLPTERLSFMTFYKHFYKLEQISREEIGSYLKNIDADNLNLEGLKEMGENAYTSAHQKLMETVYDLKEYWLEMDNNKVRYGDNNDFVQQLENLMQGKIQTSSNPINGDLSFRFEMQDNEESLKLHTTSSSINQLSTLYLYWKYWAGESNNFLIIDEPEQNLHPENQIKLTELLIQFANRNNNRVLIATHSPLIADVINNYLVLGQLENKEETRIKLGMAENAFLTPENTGIYFFTGEKVVEYKVSDYGTTFADFKAAQEKVWDAGYELGNLMYQQLKKKVDVEN